MEVLSLVLAFLGFVLLALGMKKHRELILGKGGGQKWARYAKPAGFGLIATSLLPCLIEHSPSMALTWWPGILTAAAWPVLLSLTYRPALIRHLAALAPVCAILALVVT